MYSIKKLLNAEPQNRLDKARNTANISTTNIIGGGEKYKISKDTKDMDLTKEATFQFEVRSDTGHTHHASMNFPNGVDVDLPVRCHCSCSDFKYRIAHVLWTEGSYFGTPSSAMKEIPKKTNPNMIPYLCKHLTAVSLGLRDSGFLKM